MVEALSPQTPREALALIIHVWMEAQDHLDVGGGTVMSGWMASGGFMHSDNSGASLLAESEHPGFAHLAPRRQLR